MQHLKTSFIQRIEAKLLSPYRESLEKVAMSFHHAQPHPSRQGCGADWAGGDVDPDSSTTASWSNNIPMSSFSPGTRVFHSIQFWQPDVFLVLAVSGECPGYNDGAGWRAG